MTKQAQTGKRSWFCWNPSDLRPFAAVFGRGNALSTTALDLAVYGCLVVGAVGIFKALGMNSPTGVLVCLLGSLAAFGLVIFVRWRKH